MRVAWIMVGVVVVGAPAARAELGADGTVESAQASQAVAMDAAVAAVTDYLSACKAAVKSKKWDAAKAALHPKRLVDTESGMPRHALAAWNLLDERYLLSFTVGKPFVAGKGVVVPTTEDHWAVVEKGREPGVAADYFVIPLNGRWVLLDRRAGHGNFPTKASVLAASYKGYYEGQYKPPAPSATTTEGGAPVSP